MKFISRLICLLLFFISTQLAAEHYLEPLSKDSGPIDIVYTWVDGQDPDWLASRDKVLEAHTGKKPKQTTSVNRFRDRNELKYSLRSVNKFAPFVNHIYIVTAGQTPKWLKAHPKITIVDHKEIFPNLAYLPTFNSQAIEANLHRIPNLSERYIYFNDDFFLGRAVKRRDFFDRYGKIKILLSGWTTPKGSIGKRDNGFDAAWKTTNQFLDKLYAQKRRKALKHSPYAMRKSQMEQFEAQFRPMLLKVSSHPFRSQRDYVVTNGLIQYVALHERQAKLGSLINRTVLFGSNFKKNKKALREIRKLLPHTFCIQDVVKKSSRQNDELLQKFFQDYFPEPSPWEQDIP
jgi:hypothetical protein